MKYSLIIDKKARSDLREIYKYIICNFFSKSIAKNLLNKITNKILILQEYPYAFQTLYNYKYQVMINKN